MTPDQFIAAIAPSAQASMRNTKIPASFTIAQAALESAWAKSQLAQAGFNLFGVKADKSWKGPTLSLPTPEFLNMQWVKVPALWRKYPTWLACIDDHAAYFFSNPRYRLALAHITDPEVFAQAIADAGYATDPNYAAKIIAVIRKHDLTTFDKGVV